MVNYEENIVLIPAAGYSRDSLGNENSYPACLKKVDGRPAIYWIVHDLIVNGFKVFRIGVRPNYLNLVKNALISFQEQDIQIVAVVKTNNEIDTIEQLMNLDESEKGILINFGDSYCKYDLHELMSHGYSAIYGHQTESMRWASISLNKESFISSISERGTQSHENSIPVLAGVFWVRDRQSLSRLSSSNYATVAEIIGERKLHVKAIKADHWIDSDHNDVFQKSAQTGIASRSFNSLVINSKFGSIVKVSSQGQKLKSEINYYESLPKNLLHLFPRMFSFTQNSSCVEQVLEYFPFRTISEVFTQENVPNFVWERIFQRLHEITFNDLKKPGQNEYFDDPSEFFMSKILSRSEELRQFESFDAFLLDSENISINGAQYRGLNWILEKSNVLLAPLKSRISIVHGDFCFSNILADIDSGIFKLIDPRGGFHIDSIFGPQVYDVAKLAHSVLGRYDFLIAGQFHVTKEIDSYTLKIAAPQNYLDIVKLFEKEYLKDCYDIDLVRLLSSLILLSIPLLHMDDSSRAIAIYLNGIIEANLALERVLGENLH